MIAARLLPDGHLTDKGVFTSHIAVDIVRMAGGELALEVAVGARLARMRDHVIAKGQMPRDLGMAHLKGVHVMGVHVVTALAIVTAPRYAVLATWQVAQTDHVAVTRIESVQSAYHQQDVDDRFGPHAGYGRAADMMAGKHDAAQRSAKECVLALIGNDPLQPIGLHHNLSHRLSPHTRTAVLGTAVGSRRVNFTACDRVLGHRWPPR